ncbi:SMI1/KNR4 family protein [Microvirga sp. Mcv34]|uniref:SMI1/KNR4 family protein n=1 Tax=Microvirga sp. Mcv34 TaxID=2926016 RepID=UPI0021C93FAF|nr:SMI1/KNR4 family protein [Microvirga sp. Mcv34]
MLPWHKIAFHSKATRPGLPSRVQAFEQLARVSLPEDYRQFLLDINGGRPCRSTDAGSREYALIDIDWQGRPPAVSHDVAIVDYLLSVESWENVYEESKGSSLTLEGCYRVFVLEEPRIPSDFIPIGRDPGGSLFLICTGNPQPSSVWFWARDWFSWELKDQDPFHNMGFVAPRFVDFIERIKFSTID